MGRFFSSAAEIWALFLDKIFLCCYNNKETSYKGKTNGTQKRSGA